MGIYARKLALAEDTIADGGTTSTGVKKVGMRAIGVIVPAGLEGTNLGLEVSFDNGGNWHKVINDGNPITIKATDVGFATFKMNDMESLRQVRLVSDSAQTGGVALTWVFKP